MKAMDGFLFYNSSPVAGASQSHKHMQVIPVGSLPNKKIPINDKVMEIIKKSSDP
jgi:ATP adenylyltransferase/5',5'''-P-1,P-4-tetraphosphate phosphorylase II